MAKKSISVLLVLCLTVTTALFAALWLRAATDHREARLLAQAGAAEAHDRFVDYLENGEEGDYWYGVASFRSMMQAYHVLTEGTNKAPNYTFLNEVYGTLVLDPARGQSCAAELVDALVLLAANVEDKNGYLRLSELRNAMQK